MVLVAAVHPIVEAESGNLKPKIGMSWVFSVVISLWRVLTLTSGRGGLNESSGSIFRQRAFNTTMVEAEQRVPEKTFDRPKMPDLFLGFVDFDPGGFLPADDSTGLSLGLIRV